MSGAMRRWATGKARRTSLSLRLIRRLLRWCATSSICACKATAFAKSRWRLNAEKVPSPRSFYYMAEGRENLRGETPCWNDVTVKTILRNEVYIGHMVQNKTGTVSTKTTSRSPSRNPIGFAWRTPTSRRSPEKLGMLFKSWTTTRPVVALVKAEQLLYSLVCFGAWTAVHPCGISRMLRLNQCQNQQ